MAYVTEITCNNQESVDIELVGLVIAATGQPATWDSVTYQLFDADNEETQTGTLTEDATTPNLWRAECVSPAFTGRYRIRVTVVVGSTRGIFEGTMRVKS